MHVQRQPTFVLNIRASALKMRVLTMPCQHAMTKDTLNLNLVKHYIGIKRIYCHTVHTENILHECLMYIVFYIHL